EAASVAVSIDVKSGMLLEFVTVKLSPLGGAQKHGLLPIPRAVDDGALRLPSLLEQLTQGAGFFEQRDLPGDGIFRAVDPAVMVVAADNPLVGRLGTGNAEDHVIDRLDVPVERDLQVDFRRTGANVVGDGQGAAKAFRRDRALESGQQGPGITVREGQRGDLGERGAVLEGEALYIAFGADAGPCPLA